MYPSVEAENTGTGKHPTSRDDEQTRGCSDVYRPGSANRKFWKKAIIQLNYPPHMKLRESIVLIHVCLSTDGNVSQHALKRGGTYMAGKGL